MFIAIKSKENSSGALEAARRHSPNIEIVDETTLVFDLTGSKAREAPKIAKELREKFEAVAVSENLAAALLLATQSREEEFRVQSSGFRVRKADLNAPGVESAGEREGGCSSKQTRNSEHGTLNSLVESAGEREGGCSSKQTLNPPPVDAAGATYAGGDACAPVKEEFKVQGSTFNVCKTDDEAKKASSGKQTRNSEPGTLNPPAESAGERESGCSSKQTRNPEHGTLNSPQAPLSTQYSVPSTHLSALPIDAITRKADFLDLMDSWAIHDLGSFAQLPEDEMVARFGLEIVELRKQAAGEAFRASNWNVHDDKFFWEKELEGAIETIEPLNFVLSKGVAQIFRNLDYVGLSTQSAKITLKGREKEKIYRIRIVFPTKNQKLWIRQIVTRIELDTPRFNIDRVGIEFRSVKPRIVQNNLYSGAILEPENLDLIVSKLKKVVGLTKIGVPRLRDAWRKRFYMTEDLSALIKERGTRGEGQGTRGRGEDRPRKSGQWSVVGGQAVENAGERESGCSSEQTRNRDKGRGTGDGKKFRVPGFNSVKTVNLKKTLRANKP